MKKTQNGLSTVSVAVITGAAVAGVVGALAVWQQKELMHVRGELSDARSEINTANASANAARTQLDAIRKELHEHKLDFDQMRAERDSARNLLEAEKLYTERMRAEVTVLREQLTAASAARLRNAPQPAAVQGVPPRQFRVVPSSSVGAARAQPARP